MNGFEIMADTYRKAGNEKKARIYDFLGTCDQDDFYTLFDSTAFNEIAKDYMRAAVGRLIDNGTIDEKQGRAVRNEYAFLFDEKQAREVYEG